MNRIDYYRKKKNLSYKDIAKSASISPAYVCLLAKGGRKNPSKEVMEKIANCIERSVYEVFFLEDHR